MTKADLINVVSEKGNITRVKAEMIVTTVFNSMAEALKKGDRIELRGLGSFEVRQYGAYKGRNPRDGAVIHVPRKRQAFFTVGKNLKRQVAGKTPTS